MISFAGSKINIGLYVTGKRDDGYHNLVSVFYPINLQDAVEVVEAEEFSFKTYGLEVAGEEEDNLCVKAWRMLEKDFKLPPVSAYLLKQIPMGAGLGGGSSDGSTMLKLVNDFFKLSIPGSTLENYAAQLGSDCPFFIRNRPAMVSGRGEQMDDIALNLEGMAITIVYPRIFISTAEAFQNISISEKNITLNEDILMPVEEWRGRIENAFEDALFQKYPQLVEIKDALYDAGALYVSLTGSGSAIYALSSTALSYENAAYWVWKSRL